MDPIKKLRSELERDISRAWEGLTEGWREMLTRGSAALLYRRKFLFTGDHLWGTEEGELGASRSVCWYSWSEQMRSIERLLEFDFEWVLPGHERRFRTESAAAMRKELERLLLRLRRSTSIRATS